MKDIRDYFSSQVTPVVHNVDKIKSDIETYVKGHVDKLLKRRKLFIMSVLLKKKVDIACLTEKAQGMYVQQLTPYKPKLLMNKIGYYGEFAIESAL